MLGFASFAEVPFAVSKTSAILALSVSEVANTVDNYNSVVTFSTFVEDNTTYLAEPVGQRGLFFIIEEATGLEDVLPTQVTFTPQVTESAEVFALLTATATYNVPVTEQTSFDAEYPTTVSYNVPLTDEVSLYDETFCRLLWEQVVTQQELNWAQGNNEQSNTWSTILTQQELNWVQGSSEQATTWSNIDVDQGPGWNDITDV